MYDGYTMEHPPGGTGLARWQSNPGSATTPSAQALAGGATPPATPPAGRPVRPPPPVSAPSAGPPSMQARAQSLLAQRRPAPAPAAPAPNLAPPTAAPPPATSLAAPAPAAPMTSLTAAQGGGYGQSDGFVANGEAQAQAPLNVGGTPLSGAQLAALAGTGRPGDPFTGGFTPNGGWNGNNGGRTPEQLAAAVAAYKTQYGDPSVGLDQVLARTSNDQSQLGAFANSWQNYVDNAGRFLPPGQLDQQYAAFQKTGAIPQ